MKRKLSFKRFGGTFGTLSFDERLFFITLSGFEPYWDYEPTNALHADSPGVYTSEKNLNWCTIDKIHLKTDIIDESIVNGSGQPILYRFGLDKPTGYKVFSEPETIH